MLTIKQRDLLMLIHTRLSETGIAPSFDEMKDAVGLKSKSGIHRLITALEERGFLRRLHQRARALEVVRLPEDVAPIDVPSESPRYQELRAKGFGNDDSEPASFSAYRDRKAQEAMRQSGMRPLHANSNESIALPLMGRIAAGLPIEAMPDEHSNKLDVPANMLGSGDYYALEVAGDSMIEEGIMDGDMVVIQRTNQAHNGEIVVALVDGFDVTLKRFRKNGGSIALEPANRNYETRVFNADQVAVQGRLVGLLRNY